MQDIEFFYPINLSNSPICRVICFPYAAAPYRPFNSFAQHLPKSFDIYAMHPPSRFYFKGFNLANNPNLLVQVLADELEALICWNTFFLGYSMGALVAYEVLKNLIHKNKALPQALLLAAASMPCFNKNLISVSSLPDSEIYDFCYKLGGVPEQIYNNPDIKSISIPLMRTDFKLFDYYVRVPPIKVEKPIFAYSGLCDPFVSTESMAAWSQVTCENFSIKYFNSDHFFIDSCETSFATHVVNDCLSLLN
jgi:medium-chain acyl-[acyl-carrier-protein] hydrolase